MIAFLLLFVIYDLFVVCPSSPLFSSSFSFFFPLCVFPDCFSENVSDSKLLFGEHGPVYFAQNGVRT